MSQEHEMKKRVLFLDDDHRRIAEIRARMAVYRTDLTVVETADECIAELAGGRFDLVMLDHDLGGEIFCDSSREDCGMEVVRWLRRNGGEHGAFIVHTMNPVAAAGMYLELSSMGYRVAQATFGSGTFYGHIEAMLGQTLPPAPARRRSFSEWIGSYFRSLRPGR
jgi:CheY-like chemotaxis protein